MSVKSLHGMSAAAPEAATTASPNSSDEVESQTVTPSTRLSNLTPGEIHDLPSSGSRGIIRAKVPPPFDLKLNAAKTRSRSPTENSTFFAFNDPFVSASSLGSATTRSSTDPSKLSPAAASFTPASVPDSPTSPNHNVDTDLSNFRKVGRDPDFVLPSTSLKDTKTGHLSKDVASSPLRVPHLSNRLSSTTARPHKPHEEYAAEVTGNFSSEDGISRCLMVQVGFDVPLHQINQRFSLDSYPSLLGLITSGVASEGVVYLRFADLRDAVRAFAAAKSNASKLAVQYITPMHFANKHQMRSFCQTPISSHEGQLIIVLTFVGHAEQYESSRVILSAKEALGCYGDVMILRELQSDIADLVLRVEFYNIHAAATIFTHKDSLKIPMFSLNIELYEPDFSHKQRTPHRNTGPIIIGPEDPAFDQSFTGLSLETGHEVTRSSSARQSPYMSTSGSRSFTDRKEAVGQHTPSPLSGLAHATGMPTSVYGASWSPSFHNYGAQSPMWSPYSPGAIGQERGSPTMISHHPFEPLHPQSRTLSRVSSRQQVDFVNANHNVVEVDRIRAGLDVRTTIMLRNIPNKIDQAMLKDIVDETSLGKYDFMYLRIDFANNCNVGYAFINFEDPIWIVDFVTARAGHRWNRYNSDKVAEVSYATIQGRDCLIQKFRNSSVMLEHPSFRPKLYRTGTGSLVGTEETFPGPDNPSKMRRSVENAEHVGLFAPRAGQNFRDEQRRRRSQFDRGTRMAEVEDVYEASSLSIRDHTPSCRSVGTFPTFETAYQGLHAPFY